MKRFFALVKKDFLLDYPYLVNPKTTFKDKKLRKKSLLQLFVFGILLVYLFIFMKPVFKLYDSYKAAGIPLAFLALGFMSYLFMLLVFSFPYILSKIYFSKDVETMLSLPLASEEILASKFLSLTFSSLIYAVFLVIPIMFKFGFAEKMGPIYYIYGFLGLVL
ncbi:MAG TPA: hypothetical protein VFD08_01690, partial [Clostridia bacterium]|nr:hypothetical protein [Clostridia bacterium]